ncbi:MAG: alpha/beta hydrolase, partial [Pseudomonadota bacterium]
MTALVLIPGLLCDARLFQPQIAAFSGHHDIFLPRITEADNVEDLAQNILDAVPHRFALAGLSMGGIVAME